MNTLDLTRRDLIRALRPAVDGAVRARAEALARRIEDAAPDVTATTEGREDGGTVVTVSGPGLFAREFGSIDQAAEPVIGPAVAAEADAGKAP